MTAVDHDGRIDAARRTPARRIKPVFRAIPIALDRLDVVMLTTVAMLSFLQVGLVLVRLGGHFSYSLDDPYIHLALAENIAHGHYGLNAGEAAAPSSSIMFPFLLATLWFTGIGQYSALAVDFAATLVGGLLLSALLKESISVEKLPAAALPLMAVALVLSFNLIGLELTGLEHSLHVAVTLACVLGTLRFLRSGSIAPWWWLAAMAEPMIRYEGASILVATACLLACHRRAWPALALLLAGALPVVLFSLFLHRLGLPPLPNSVLAKSGVAVAGTQASFWAMIEQTRDMIAENAATVGGLRLIVLCGLLVTLVGRRSGPEAPRQRVAAELAIFALFVSLAHLAFRRFGWFARYEIYVLTLDAMVLIYGFGPRIDRYLEPATSPRYVIAALIPMAFFSTYVHVYADTPLAAQNIYDQQYQMHRFVDEFYRKPVGVNDLGWVAYESPTYTLDFWGLGSEQARRARMQADESGEWMEDVARDHDVGLAMIYPQWFDHVPSSWQPVARLSFGAPRVTASEAAVTFYATRPEAEPAIAAALAAFDRTLPSGTSLERLPRP